MGKAVNPGETERQKTLLLFSVPHFAISSNVAVCELWDLDIYSCQSLHVTSLHLLHPLFAQILKIRSCENRFLMRFFSTPARADGGGNP